MRIAQVSSLVEQVPPPKYGGLELVVHNLTEELVRHGHDVTLFASGDSKTKAKLVPITPRALRYRKDITKPEIYYYILQGELLERAQDFDIIHVHISVKILPLNKFSPTPILSTLHGRLNIPEVQEVILRFPEDIYYNSISLSQQGTFPELKFFANVYNGIDVKKFEFNDRPQNYLAFLGRISPEKGIKEAILATLKAKEKLIIAAKIDRVDEEYYKKEIESLIDRKQIKFIGEVGHKGKVELLKNAKALLNPINWPEPFGLVMPEAMACGTPVIATKRASAPETIVEGKTGFLVNPKRPIEGIVRVLSRINEISREDCREHVEKNFSVEKMVDGYEKTYKEILKIKRKK